MAIPMSIVIEAVEYCGIISNVIVIVISMSYRMLWMGQIVDDQVFDRQ